MADEKQSDNNRIADLAQGILMACGALAVMANDYAVVEQRMAFCRLKVPGSPPADVESAEKTLRLLYEAMNVLGDAREEPGEWAVEATTPAFRRVAELLGEE